MFQKRKEEGFFSVLIEKHLLRDEKIFREFFRLSWEQFNYVLNLIEDDIKSNPCNRVKRTLPGQTKPYNVRENALLGVFARRRHAFSHALYRARSAHIHNSGTTGPMNFHTGARFIVSPYVDCQTSLVNAAAVIVFISRLLYNV